MDSLLMNSYANKPFTLNLFNYNTSFPKSKFPSRIRSYSVSIKSSQCPNYRFYSTLAPIVKRIKHIAATVSSNQLVSIQNGAFGTALLSVTSRAKVKISPFVSTLAANPTFVSGFFAWAIAQSMKVFLHYYFERKWDFRIMCASGGMPSSHSALCTALTTSVAISHGVADSLFPVCLGFSLIVMHDAVGVRRHAGMQAQVLNVIVEDLFKGHPISERKLKELLGHTLSQVVAGALLGFLVACLCSQPNILLNLNFA